LLGQVDAPHLTVSAPPAAGPLDVDIPAELR
jgi:hypothetical protein